MTKTNFGAPGGWIDESVPDLAELLDGLQIDAEGFKEWLGLRLGELRLAYGLRKGESSIPTYSEELAALRHYYAALDAVVKLQPNFLTMQTKAELATEGLRDGFRWMEAAQSFQMDAVALRAVAGRALHKLETAPAPGRGRPKGRTRPRDELLREIIERLISAGAATRTARDLAEQILVLAGLPVPTGERSVRRATRRTKGGKK